ncbi:MAG TPA: DUF5683 domain-containing protein, partial [Draconibacterium sp.]|nr:DUF5683 domain-containing protein [Draconibacterium sp.]
MGRKSILLKSTFIITLLLVGYNLQAQLVNADTTRIIKTETDLESVHSPKKATLYSAILPGLGQAYNKKYWKIPLVYIGFGAIGYFIKWNNDNYQINKKAYHDLTDNDPDTKFYETLTAFQYYDLNNPTSEANFKDGLNKRQEYYRRNRDMLIISMAGFYGLQIIDASVDAHLFNFDMSDDLTL